MEWARLDSSGTGRKQAMDAMASQDLRNAFSAKAFLVEAGKRNPFPASTGKKESNHGLNDKPENPWYPEPVVRGKRKRGPRRSTLKTEQHSGKANNREEKNLP